SGPGVAGHGAGVDGGEHRRPAVDRSLERQPEGPASVPTPWLREGRRVRLSGRELARPRVHLASRLKPEQVQRMLLPFFTALREARAPVSLKEWLHLMEAMDKGVAGPGS